MKEGDIVYEEDLLDMTTEFAQIRQRFVPYFESEGELNSDYFGYGWTPGGYVDKMTNFGFLVGTDMPYDLKSNKRNNLTEIPSYAAIVIGQYSFMQGRLMTQDDYGNISYGYWGKAYGYGLGILLPAASAAQLASTGSFDSDRDQYMIKLGFNMNPFSK